MLMKLSDGLKTEMWELSDFGHETTMKELGETLKKFAMEISVEKLALAVRVLRTLAR